MSYIDEIKNYKIGICCFSVKHTSLRSTNKYWLARNQNNVVEWSEMSTRWNNNNMWVDMSLYYKNTLWVDMSLYYNNNNLWVDMSLYYTLKQQQSVGRHVTVVVIEWHVYPQIVVVSVCNRATCLPTDCCCFSVWNNNNLWVDMSLYYTLKQ
jgi:hypothetical protein